MNQKQSKVIVFLLVVYTCILVWTILFKLGFSLSYLHTRRMINLIPLRGMSIKQAFHESEILLNVVIFIPFAFYLRMLKVNWIVTIVCCFVFSLFMEVTQYVLAIGVTDVTDLITNTTGGVIGVILYGIITFPFQNKEMIHRILTIVAMIVTFLFLTLFTILTIYNT